MGGFLSFYPRSVFLFSQVSVLNGGVDAGVLPPCGIGLGHRVVHFTDIFIHLLFCLLGNNLFPCYPRVLIPLPPLGASLFALPRE